MLQNEEMADTSKEPLNISHLVDESGKNKQTIFCTRCPSKILCKGVGVYIEVKYSLPNVGPKQSLGEGVQEEEELKDYWQVDNMFNFENIGYSNTVDGRKFLVCADCESGPLGWQNLETKSSYLAAQRVKYCE